MSYAVGCFLSLEYESSIELFFPLVLRMLLLTVNDILFGFYLSVYS
jgi:hypothetical protein